MKIYLFLFLAIVISISTHCIAQVEITLKNWKAYTGIIKNENNEVYELTTLDNVEIIISKKDYSTIRKMTTNINLSSGSNFSGYISRSDSSSYYLTGDLGEEIVIPKKSVQSLSVEDKGHSFQNFNIQNGNNIQKAIEYPSFGLTVGTPGGININYGYLFGKYGFRGTIGYGPDYWMGIQFNFLYNLLNLEHFEHNLLLGFGHMVYENYSQEKWTYIGFFYNMNIYGFFIEPGLTIGSGDYKNPQIACQIGYVYRFNDK